VRLKTGGKARYVLSGLLACAECGSHYIMGDLRSYVCSGFVGGKSCDNSTRVKRVHLERVLVGPIKDGLLLPDRIERIAREMQASFAAQAKAGAQRGEQGAGRGAGARREAGAAARGCARLSRTWSPMSWRRPSVTAALRRAGHHAASARR